jgi:hypothetical protein
MNGQEYKLFDNFIYNGTTYELLVKNNETDKNYSIQIKESDTKKAESVNLTYKYDENVFVSTIEQLLKGEQLVNEEINKQTLIDILTPKWIDIYRRLFKDLTKKEVITELYDNQEIEYAFNIKLNKESKSDKARIPLEFDEKGNYHAIKKQVKKRKRDANDLKCVKADQVNDEKVTLAKNYKGMYSFEPKYASIRFFNNRVNKIAVVGDLFKNEGLFQSDITMTNSSYSVPFKYLIKDGGKLTYSIDGYDFLIDWNDLLNILPIDTEYSYAVKNKSYHLEPNKPVKVESRNLFDYFTAIIFSDFLGLNNTNNNLLSAEARALIPLALVNKGRWNSPEYVETYVNTSIYNGQEDAVGEVLWDGKKSSKIPIFDFFKKRNIEAGVNLGLCAFEWRGISSTFTFGYGAQFYRTKLHQKRDQDDLNPAIDENIQLYAIGHGPKLKIDIRPQTNFGGDLNIGLLGYNFNGFNKNVTTTSFVNVSKIDNTTTPPTTTTTKEQTSFDFKNDVLDHDRTFFNTLYIVSNLYTKLNAKESNSGLYFRLGVFYDFHTYTVSPQIMVGYATNLTSFINKFNKRDDKPADSKASK